MVNKLIMQNIRYISQDKFQQTEIISTLELKVKALMLQFNARKILHQFYIEFYFLNH